MWVDANRDSTQNAGEPGIPGVTVALIRDTQRRRRSGMRTATTSWECDDERIIATDVTDARAVPLQRPADDDGTGTNDYMVWVNDTDNVLAGLTPTYDYATAPARAPDHRRGHGLRSAR